VPDDSLRERILSASIALIEEEGLSALSLREVARRAGVSHQAPYHYFADREAILATLAERGFATLQAAVEAARCSGTGPTEALELAAIAYVQFACDHPAHFRLMFRPELVALKDHPESANRSFNHVPAMVVDCMKAGLPESFGVEVMSTLFWSIVHGLACLLLDGPLVMRVPELMKDQKRTIAQVAHAARLMVEASMVQGRAKPSMGAKRKKRKTRST
jgi:AcrR family transcriptional regulator